MSRVKIRFSFVSSKNSNVKFQNILKVNVESLSKSRCDIKSQQLLKSFENAFAQQNESRLRSTREKRHQKCEMSIFMFWKVSRWRLDRVQYINMLIKQYSFRTFFKKKSMIDLDDLYFLLYTHWILNDATYTNERQRVQVVINIFVVVFFDCRSCFLFDTRVKFENSNDFDESLDTKIVVYVMNDKKTLNIMKINRDHHKKCYDDFDCEVNNNINLINHENNDNDNDNNYDNENEHDNDFNLSYFDDENRDIDDDRRRTRKNSIFSLSTFHHQHRCQRNLEKV